MNVPEDAPNEAGKTQRARGVPPRQVAGLDAPAEAAAPRRRRAGQAIVWSEQENLDMRPRATVRTLPSPPLTIRRTDEEDRITLHLIGALEMASLLRLRDEAFVAVGEHPACLCLDLHLLSRVEFAGVSTLVTIGRVARLAGTRFVIRASATFAQTLRDTGLVRTLTLEEAPSVIPDGNVSQAL